jgi:putative Mg2+ transporter-C (MgtC) family protein
MDAVAREAAVMSGWHELPRMLLNLGVAFALGIPVGWDREHQRRGPGIRTYPLLALGASAYVEIGQFAFHDHIEGQARVFQALVSGIGFIGAGAIIKGPVKVRGLATAVSLWITVSVGIAAAYELFALAAVLSGTTLVALRLLEPLKFHPKKNEPKPRDGADRDESG